MVMMGLKILFVVIAGILALPALAYPRAKFNANRAALGQLSNNDLVQVAHQTLQTITEAVNNSMEEVVDALKKMLEELESVKQEAFRAAAKVIDQDISDFKELLGRVKALVDERKLVQCTDNEQQFSFLQDEAADYVFQCITLVAQQVSNDTQVVLTDFAQLNNAIEEANQNLESCRSEECVKGAIDDLVQVALYVPPKLQRDADKTQFEYQNVLTGFEKCILDTDTVIKQQGSQIYNNITQCLEVSDAHNDDNYWYYSDD